MYLLIFAHRGEAQSFINEAKFIPCEFTFDGLFKNDQDYLLITGEGPQAASERTMATLSLLHSEIEKVINLGIAGSLIPGLKVDDLKLIRSVYAQHAEKLEFKSFTTKLHDDVDCITAFARITEKNQKKELSAFADIVDRELWSIASAAHFFKKEFIALKVISDDLSTDEACELIRQNALHFSRLLLKGYREKIQFPSRNLTPLPEIKQAGEYSPLEDERFYFTVTQKRILAQLLHGLTVKNLLSNGDLKKLCSALITDNPEKSPKEYSRYLIIELSDRLHPLKKQIRQKIEQAISPLTDAGINVHFDPELESSALNLTFRIHQPKDQKRVILALEHFNLQKIKDIFNGKIDDDV